MNEKYKYHRFENWLKENNYVSWAQYISFMKAIDQTLMVKDFENITSSSILQQLFSQLQGNRAFAARSKSDRDNILSGFRAYINFIDEARQKGK